MAKILEIGNYPPPMCGWAIQTKLLEEELGRRNHICRVLKINEGRQAKSSHYVDVQNGFDYLAKLLKFSFQGYRFHMHVNGGSPKGYVLALLAVMIGRLSGKPSVLTFHGGLPQAYFPRQDSLSLRTAFRLLFYLAGSLTCDSDEIRAAIESYSVSFEKVTAIPCFSEELLNFTVVKLPVGIERFLASHDPVFSCYVSFRPEYRLPVLRKAMDKFRKIYPKAGFIWLGFPEKEMSAVRNYVSEWPEEERENLELIGNLNHDEFLTLVSRCFAAVRTPACDGISASVIEALVLGIPVIASENGRRPKGVVTYREEDADDLTEKLVYVAQNYTEIRERTKFENPENNTRRMADWILRGTAPATPTVSRPPERNRISGRFRRIFEMSWDELRDRGRQELTKRWDAARYRLAGVRVDQAQNATQFASGAKFFFSTEDIPALLATLRDRFPSAADEIIRSADRICSHQFDLLGFERVNYGSQIDWHLDAVHGKRAPRKPWFKIRYLDFAEVADAKITWELNRHQHFVTLAKAYLLTREERFAKEIFRQWADWHDANTYPIGINWASSLEVGFRVFSWLWTWHLLAGTPVMPSGLGGELRRALTVSGVHIEKYLSTYFSPNTHLLGEGVALFFLGMLCPDLPRANHWKSKGWDIVLQEAKRQVRADGVHFEQSTYYHVYALDFFLHSRILALLNGVPIPEELDQVIQKMLDYLAILAQAGVPPRMGDDDGGRLFDPRRNRVEHLLDPLATGAAVFGRADFKAASGGPSEETLWLLGPRGLARFDQLHPDPRPVRSVAFRESGIFLMADSFPTKQQLTIDAGPQGGGSAGHGHADALSICLAVDGRQLLGDPGTCCYVSDDATRDLFRGTGAHNTLRIDEQDQSVPGGPFSWGPLAETEVEHWSEGKASDFFQGFHRGYARLSGSPVHRRTVFHLKPGLWLVHDRVAGAGDQTLELSWHLPPDIRVSHSSPNSFLIGPEAGRAIALLMPESSSCDVKIEDGFWSSVYGRKEPSAVLRLQLRGGLPAEICALLLSRAGVTSGAGKFVSSRTTGEGVSSYSYLTREGIQVSVFAQNSMPWRAGCIRSDARFLHVVFDLREQAKYFALSAGSFVNIDDHLVFSSERPLEYHEWFADGSRESETPSESVAMTRGDE